VLIQAEKAKQFLYQAKYGRFGLVDPVHALQQQEVSGENNVKGHDNKAAAKAIYEDQLMQLEHLIDTQHKSQEQMREQLSDLSSTYHTVN